MKRKLRIISVLLLAVLCFCTFSSCEKAGTELADLMIIQGIGIDVNDAGYKVTVEILNNEQSGSPSGDSSSDNKTKIYTAEGVSVAEALRTLITKSGNEPLFAHNRVIVIGETAANRKLSDIIDFFVRNYDSRATQLICVAKETTGESVIRAKLLNDTVKSEILEKMLQESYEQSLAPRVRIIDAINIIKSETSVLCIPAVTVQKNGENEDFKLDGCAVFGRDETFSMYISAGDAQGLAFLTDTVEKGYFSAELLNGNTATFVINKGKSHFSVSEENGVLTYRVDIEISCDIEEVYGAEYFSVDEDFFDKMKSSAAEAICQKCENTAVVLKSEHGGDALRYGERLQLYDNDLYKKLKNNWEEEFKKAETVVSVDVTVRRIGEETFHSKKQ